MRLLVSMLLGLVVALSLFVLDHKLISRQTRPDDTFQTVKFVDFVRVQRNNPVNVKDRRMPKKPPPVKDPPPPQKFQAEVPQDSPRLPVAIDVPNIGFNIAGGSGVYLGSGMGSGGGPITGDAEVIPVVRIQPRYPRDALMDGVEGWVRMEFVINKDGSVGDVRVLDADPPRVFNQSAVRAILRWKFRPRVIEGKPVERRASQTIEFKLENA